MAAAYSSVAAFDSLREHELERCATFSALYIRPGFRDGGSHHVRHANSPNPVRNYDRSKKFLHRYPSRFGFAMKNPKCFFSDRRHEFRHRGTQSCRHLLTILLVDENRQFAAVVGLEVAAFAPSAKFVVRVIREVNVKVPFSATWTNLITYTLQSFLPLLTSLI